MTDVGVDGRWTLAAVIVGFAAGLISCRPLVAATKRLKTADHIPPEWIRQKRRIRGVVASVGDVC